MAATHASHKTSGGLGARGRLAGLAEGADKGADEEPVEREVMAKDGSAVDATKGERL
jgi:hypothetical protein